MTRLRDIAIALLVVLLLSVDGWGCKGAAKSVFRGAARTGVRVATVAAMKPPPRYVCVDPRTDECVYLTGNTCTRPLRPPTDDEYAFCRGARP